MPFMSGRVVEGGSGVGGGGAVPFRERDLEDADADTEEDVGCVAPVDAARAAAVAWSIEEFLLFQYCLPVNFRRVSADALRIL